MLTRGAGKFGSEVNLSAATVMILCISGMLHSIREELGSGSPLLAATKCKSTPTCMPGNK